MGKRKMKDPVRLNLFLPRALHRELKRRAQESGVSMGDYVRNLLSIEFQIYDWEAKE